jgi:hypothetical protein
MRTCNEECHTVCLKCGAKLCVQLAKGCMMLPYFNYNEKPFCVHCWEKDHEGCKRLSDTNA